MNKAVTEKVLEAVTGKHKGLSDAILCVTVDDVQRIIEDAIDETKREIAKRVADSRTAAIAMLVQDGIIDEDLNVEEALFEELESL